MMEFIVEKFKAGAFAADLYLQGDISPKQREWIPPLTELLEDADLYHRFIAGKALLRFGGDEAKRASQVLFQIAVDIDPRIQDRYKSLQNFLIKYLLREGIGLSDNQKKLLEEKIKP